MIVFAADLYKHYLTFHVMYTQRLSETEDEKKPPKFVQRKYITIVFRTRWYLTYRCCRFEYNHSESSLNNCFCNGYYNLSRLFRFRHRKQSAYDWRTIRNNIHNVRTLTNHINTILFFYFILFTWWLRALVE